VQRVGEREGGTLPFKQKERELSKREKKGQRGLVKATGRRRGTLDVLTVKKAAEREKEEDDLLGS